jgi:hypothetical protein
VVGTLNRIASCIESSLLDAQAKASKLYRQYDRDKLLWLARPRDLPQTNLAGAFEPGP